MLNKKFFDKAIAIEPDPGNFELLTRNVKQNGLQDSVLCVASAVSDRKGTVSFELSNGNFGDHRVRMHGRVCAGDLNDESSRKVIDVVSESLDGILDSVPAKYSDDIALIWIDVQGHEGYVFLGGKNIFSKDISVVTEIWPYGIQRSGMTRDQFCGIVQNIWSGYWVMRRGRFVRYPISMIGTFFDELNAGSSFDNCIFTK
jgi:FkbM family methyltransferase